MMPWHTSEEVWIFPSHKVNISLLSTKDASVAVYIING